VKTKIESLEDSFAAISLGLASSADDEIKRGIQYLPVLIARSEKGRLSNVPELELRSQHRTASRTIATCGLKAADLTATRTDHTARAKAAATSAITGATKGHLARILGLRAIERRSLGPACDSTRSIRRARVSWGDVVRDCVDRSVSKSRTSKSVSKASVNKTSFFGESNAGEFDGGADELLKWVIAVSVKRSVEAGNKLSKPGDLGKLVNELK